MTLNDYKYLVYREAKNRGYSDSEIEAFLLDIEDNYYSGLSVDECVDKEF